MARKKEEFETEEQGAESIAAANILNELELQEQKDIEDVMNPPVSVEESKPAEPEQTSIKTSDNEKEADIKTSAFNIFKNVLNIEKKETKSKKANFLLTETNFNHLVELSEKAGVSRNEMINKLIDSCYQNAGL